jgi:adenine-specific DNA-methyltransferase
MMLLDEVFGEESFVAVFPWKKRTAKSDVPFGVSQEYEWIICYAKPNFVGGLFFERKYYKTPDYPNDRWRLSDLTTQKLEADRPNSVFDLVNPKTGKIYPYNPKRLWGITKDTFKDYYDKGKIVFPDDYDFLNITIPAYRVFESEDKAKALKKYGSEEAMKAITTGLPKEVGMSEDGNNDIFELFGKKIFSYPKPVSLIKHLVKFSTRDGDLILDFFAGSGTTAQAVLTLNKEEDENRKFVLVQLPEVIETKSEAYKSGYKTITDIAKERIRRVIKGYGDEPQPIDDGFKVFKLAESNYPENLFDFDPEKSEEENRKAFGEYLSKTTQMKLFDDTKAIDVVYETIIKEGLSLNSKIIEREIGKNTAYFVADGERQLLVCLNKKIDEKTINELTGKDYKGKTFICLDNALDDTAKANLGLHVELKTI